MLVDALNYPTILVPTFQIAGALMDSFVSPSIGRTDSCAVGWNHRQTCVHLSEVLLWLDAPSPRRVQILPPIIMAFTLSFTI